MVIELFYGAFIFLLIIYTLLKKRALDKEMDFFDSEMEDMENNLCTTKSYVEELQNDVCTLKKEVNELKPKPKKTAVKPKQKGKKK